MRGTVKAVLASLVLFASPMALPAHAGTTSDLSAAYNENTDVDFRRGLQMRLAWTGDYSGDVDGRIGAQTLRAIRDFQARHGHQADGVMDEAFLRRLIAESDKASKGFGYELVSDDTTGATIGLPLARVSEIGNTEVGKLWRSDDGAVEIESVRFSKEHYSLREIFDVLSTPTDTKTISLADLKADRFTIRGVEDGRNFFIRFAGRGTDLRGFSVAYEPSEPVAIESYISVASNMFEPFAAEPEGDLGPVARLFKNGQAAGVAFGEGAALPGTQGGQDKGFDSSGTGFVVSKDGWLLTNAHVAKSCKSVMVGDVGTASQVVVDAENDLALIKVDGKVGAPLPIVEGKPRLGEDILALGFPLRSILADSLNVTRGNISSLMGLMNDPNYLQISAPVQPGNSGGPLVDLSGRVVGVVTAKLNAVAVADLTGDIPQSINFAIRPDAAARFMTANHIAFEAADAKADLKSVPDATASVQDSIYPVLCLGGQ